MDWEERIRFIKNGKAADTAGVTSSVITTRIRSDRASTGITIQDGQFHAGESSTVAILKCV